MFIAKAHKKAAKGDVTSELPNFPRSWRDHLYS